ncbi:rho-type GTPase-activating protein 1 [Zalerion maritima]|uniref:Rho-type GTPase-activating protein 1 n=1 Tax=Zalerion maritima TaxID=339359 RepID=A0AAD5S690_9PEZI|nr:rho-type GTPase-activating protein 1 [Zalerion maritima]
MAPGDYLGGSGDGRDRDQTYLPPGDASYRHEFDSTAGTPSPSWHNVNFPTYPPPRHTQSPALSHDGRDKDVDSRRSAERNRSRPRNNNSVSGRSASGTMRICKKCGEQLTGQFVRALDGTFHLDCFRCRDCGEIVASKFFPADDNNGEGQYPLCETDYFRRLDLLCHQCGGALRGSYITALDRKYHVDHFTCSLCPTVFGAQDSYYEHEGEVYCHYHYSTQFAQRCNGCQTAILKQFVEIYRNGQNQHWHPECYMIHKFWNVRLSPPVDTPNPIAGTDDAEGREMVRVEEERMEEKVYRIWSVLSTFEESSAACISDMLLHVSNGAYVDGVLVAKRFIWHVEILFQSADGLDSMMSKYDMKGLSYGREAKLLCKKIVAFFSLLSKTQDTTTKKLGVTQELLSLVTGLAHYLKLLIRICLQGALKVEREHKSSDGLYQFLDDLGDLDAIKNDDTLLITNGMSRLSANDSDQCSLCRKSIEDECVKSGEQRWHVFCVSCVRCGKELGRSLQEARLNPYDQKLFCSNCLPQGIADQQQQLERISKLQQYVFLLRVALARLLEILRSNGVISHSSEDVTLNGQESGDSRRISTDAIPPYLKNETRSKSYAGEQNERHQRESSYESTLNDVRRLRSTRLDKHLSSSFRKARASRVMDGDDGPRTKEFPGMEGGGIDEATTESMLGHENALTLDDIPRIVAAEQAAQRPHAYKQPRQELYRSPATEPAIGSGQQRSRSTGRDDLRGTGEMSPQRPMPIGRKYFSELSGLEYFIVRHVAVMTMHPMVESEFSMEELLSFIESRKPATFWNKFAKPFSKADGKKAVKKKGVFGVPLELIIERDGAESTDGVGPGALRIPAIIDDIIATMRKMDLSVEGVFRKNGNIKKLVELAEKIDREGCDGINWMDYPVVQLAALLKRYLRELPDPLMTHKLYKLWVAAAKIQDDDKRRHCLHLSCCLLPKCHRDCLEILFSFLKWAGSFHQVDEESGSKMDIKNLSTVIAPNILYSSSRAPGLDSEPMFAINAVEDLINFNEEMCLVPDDLVDLLNDPTLFNGTSDMTTKEILKRLGDRTRNGPTRPFQHTGEVYGRHENSVRPIPKRVETDPNIWQQESSVRHIQDAGPGGPPYGNPPQGTPPKRWRNPDEEGYNSPYRQDSYENPPPPPPPPPAAQDGNDGGQRKEWRNSGWRQNNSVGVQ